MPDQSLKRLFNEVRWQTLRILDGVKPSEANWAPPGLDNTILWHAGHAYVVVEWCTMASLNRSALYPDDWFDVFSGQKLTPKDVQPDTWPALETVISALEDQRDRLRDVYAHLNDEELSSEAAHKPKRSVRYMIIHGLYDEAAHGGEMWLLRKMQRSETSR